MGFAAVVVFFSSFHKKYRRLINTPGLLVVRRQTIVPPGTRQSHRLPFQSPTNARTHPPTLLKQPLPRRKGYESIPEKRRKEGNGGQRNIALFSVKML